MIAYNQIIMCYKQHINSIRVITIIKLGLILKSSEYTECKTTVINRVVHVWTSGSSSWVQSSTRPQFQSSVSQSNVTEWFWKVKWAKFDTELSTETVDCEENMKEVEESSEICSSSGKQKNKDVCTANCSAPSLLPLTVKKERKHQQCLIQGGDQAHLSVVQQRD